MSTLHMVSKMSKAKHKFSFLALVIQLHIQHECASTVFSHPFFGQTEIDVEGWGCSKPADVMHM